MMAIVNRIWILIILYTGYTVYEKYQEHQEKLKDIGSRVEIAKNKLQRSKKKVGEIEKYLENIKSAEAKMKKVEEQAVIVQKKFPSVINDAELMNLFSQTAQALNIKNIQVNTLGESDMGFYFIKTYEVKSNATYLQTLFFLEKISENEKLLNVRDILLKTLQIKQRSRHQLLDTTIRIMAYRYNSNFKPAESTPSKKQRGKK